MGFEHGARRSCTANPRLARKREQAVLDRLDSDEADSTEASVRHLTRDGASAFHADFNGTLMRFKRNRPFTIQI
jgi:hypothetical protein